MLYAINVFKYECIRHNGHAVIENIKLNNSSLHYFAYFYVRLHHSYQMVKTYELDPY